MIRPVAALAALTMALAACASSPAAPVLTPPSEEPYVAPSAPEIPPEAAVETSPPAGFACRDGSRSHAKHRRGACSHHGGVR